MSKPPSEATQLRNLKREVKGLYDDLQRMRQERDVHAAKRQTLQAEVQEWKERFDRLLLAARITVSGEKKPT